MNISLLFNESAGDGVSSDWLCDTMRKAGHGPIRVVDKHEVDQVLQDSPELVVAAGGDGTVRRAAEAIAGRGIPLAILPLGTANNIARSVGIDGSMAKLIDHWHDARRQPLDLGIVRGAWGEHRFVEGVGGGLIPAGIAAMKAESENDDEDADARVARALRRYSDVLSRLRPLRWTVTIDGTTQEGEFLILEVLNIRSVGPNLVLFPDADPSDGYLSVVTAQEEHRKALADYLQCLSEGRACRVSLPKTLARDVKIEGWEQIHVDDRLLSSPDVGTVSIGIEAAALEVLV